MKQIGLALHNHMDSWGFVPSDGWGWLWAGDPMRGFGRPQPGGYVYSLLPFLEEKQLWSLGQGINFATNPVQKEAALTPQVFAPLPMFLCPSRRTSGNGPAKQTFSGVTPAYTGSTNGLFPFVPYHRQTINIIFPGGAWVSKIDYAVNGGDGTGPEGTIDEASDTNGGPTSFAVGDSSTFLWTQAGHTLDQVWTGVSYGASQITPNRITDGLSNTVFVGEKFLCPINYLNGADLGDDEWATCGFDNDNCRVGNSPPAMDYVNSDGSNPDPTGLLFGSAHAAGCNMVFCDGSVHTVDYRIDTKTMQELCNRADGQTPSMTHVTHN